MKQIIMITVSLFAVLIKVNGQHLASPFNWLPTRWSENAEAANKWPYPRPQFKRNSWTNLNGKWQYCVTDSSAKYPIFSTDSINVPFPIESQLSGVGKVLMPDQKLWYRREIKIEKVSANYMLNFGAIDYHATVFINGKLVGKHDGGYSAFSLDISEFVRRGNNEVVVCVLDPTDAGPNPHGKQVLNPENIYYTPSSGIWQTVWLEQLEKTHMTSILLTPDIDTKTVEVTFEVINTEKMPINMQIDINSKNNKDLTKTIPIPIGMSKQKVKFSIPNAHFWSPDDPYLYDLKFTLNKNRKTYDIVESYFGMRKIDIQKDSRGIDRIFLNNKYTFNLGVLDQGFWPDGLYTAPSDEALQYDIKAIKAMGFNTIRKHIKIEPDRWYYYADKLGILVWQDFVNPPHNLPQGSKDIFEKEIKITINQLYNHPSIVAWVLFNEGWGAYDQARLSKWVKDYDPTRLLNGHSGQMLYTDNQLRELPIDPWRNSDLVDIHSYPFPRNTPNLINKAKVVGEFGGIGVSVNGHEWNDLQGWGYIQTTADEFKSQYRKMIDSLKELEKLGLSASIYTQPFDVEGEENGFITYDREIIKIPLDTIRDLNRMIIHPTFEPDSHFFIAKNLDPNDNDSRFSELLALHKAGNKDSSMLRRLTLIAFRQKKQDLLTELGNDFISMMKNPLSLSNLQFIQFITRTTKDKGFSLFIENSNKIDSILGKNQARYSIKSILEKEIIPPYKYDSSKKYNWDALQEEVTHKYGDIGEEAILGRRMVEYGGFLGNKPQWNLFGKYYVLYFKKALAHPDYRINEISWALFLHINDPEILQFAVEVMKYCIETYDRSPEALDTYANLLYKTRQTQNAIEWETKALNMLKGTSHESIFAETLQKMKDNKPTWPQN